MLQQCVTTRRGLGGGWIPLDEEKRETVCVCVCVCVVSYRAGKKKKEKERD